MEIVKVRLQTQAKGGVPKTMFDVVRELGVLGLYRGAGITMAQDVLSLAIFFACYTLLQQLYPNQNFMARCLAAIPAIVLVTPMDIIKTRLQV
jgi:solute carrier family 25 aspartate/glutamate transporter 12/13